MDKSLRNRHLRSYGRNQPLVLIATGKQSEGYEGLAEELVQVILEEARQRGWRLLDLNLTGGSLSGETAVAGALVTLLPTDPMAHSLRKMGYPLVRLGRLPHPDDAQMPAVLPDYEELGRRAGAYFAQRGFGHLGLVGHVGMEMMQLIGNGLDERAGELGYSVHRHAFDNPGPPRPDKEPEAGRYDRRTRELTAWLDTLPKPVGLVACNDWVAGMINIMCQRTGLALPEEVALLSLGNRHGACELAPVPISEIELPRRELGRTAMRLLGELIAGRQIPPRTLVPPGGVITRRSTDILAVDDPTVARTIRFMWDHLDEALSVDDVAAAMKTPRYKLERLFRRYLKRGVNAELRRARLERCRELLRTTDLTVDELAPLVGYGSAKRLHGVFRKQFDQTPRQYRLAERHREAEGQDRR